MDRFEKLTVSYLVATLIFGMLSATSQTFWELYIVNYFGLGFLTPFLDPLVSPLIGLLTGAQVLLLGSHFVYLKFFLDEVVARDDSRLWLPFTGITLQIGAIAYLIHRG